jgi:hypothetical protein
VKAPDPTAVRRSRYLLNLASEEEREAVERGFFADDDSFERLQAAEDELFDAYAAAEMPAGERAAFEQRYLSSAEGRRRLAIARALRQRADEAAARLEGTPRGAKVRSIAIWAGLAAGLVAAATAAWLVRENARLNAEIVRLRAEERSGPTPAPSVAPSPTPPAPEGPRTAQDVRLPARPSAHAVDVTLAAGTQWVRLQVALREDEDSATFDAVIRRPGGEELWRQEGLAPKRAGAPIVITAPARALADGEYVLSVEGEPSRESAAPVARRYFLRLTRSQ